MAVARTRIQPNGPRREDSLLLTYEAPEKLYQRRLNTSASVKEVLSDIS